MKPLLAAGQAIIENGQVKSISNASGHYNSAGLNSAQKISPKETALEAFANHGLKAGSEVYDDVF